jgi:hypothetical protein
MRVSSDREACSIRVRLARPLGGAALGSVWLYLLRIREEKHSVRQDEGRRSAQAGQGLARNKRLDRRSTLNSPTHRRTRGAPPKPAASTVSSHAVSESLCIRVHMRKFLAVFLIVTFAVSRFPTIGPAYGGDTVNERLRDPSLQPFASNSIWNTPLGSGAAFESADAPASSQLHSDSVGGPNRSYYWIARDSFFVFRQKPSDPKREWRYDGLSASDKLTLSGSASGGVLRIKTPRNMKFFGNDRYGVLIEAGGQRAYEMWLGASDPVSERYSARRIVEIDLLGSGAGRWPGDSAGIRAFGGSLLGGLVRCEELERGRIPHGIAVTLSPTQMRAGRSIAEESVWPATNVDDGGKNSYSGLIPMGALIAIPPQVDIGKLDLTRSGLALARAFQQFGGYVVDTAPNTFTLASMESGCEERFVAELFSDIRKIAGNLLLITNNAETQVGGPGERVAERPPPTLVETGRE